MIHAEYRMKYHHKGS